MHSFHIFGANLAVRVGTSKLIAGRMVARTRQVGAATPLHGLAGPEPLREGSVVGRIAVPLVTRSSGLLFGLSTQTALRGLSASCLEVVGSAPTAFAGRKADDLPVGVSPGLVPEALLRREAT